MPAPDKPLPVHVDARGSSEEAKSLVRPLRAPDFFIVGHQKCGTTALFMMLSQHPQIFMSDVKEPWFFGRELRSRFGKPSTRSRPNTLEDYLSLFADADPEQMIGEASPQYIRSSNAAREIAELRPDARIIVLLREPAAFLRSLHLQLITTHIEDQADFARALELEEARRAGKHIPRRSVSPQSLLYSEHVRYADQLRRLHEAFPREQVLVLVYEDFRRDNDGVVREVLDFLGLDTSVSIAPVETKPLNGVRSMRLHKLRRVIRRARLHPGAKGPVVRTLDAIAPQRLSGDAISAAFRRIAYRPQQPADEELMRRLRRRFKPQVEAASAYLGRDLTGQWGYERID
jgi:sulfotransferase family protein